MLIVWKYFMNTFYANLKIHANIYFPRLHQFVSSNHNFVIIVSRRISLYQIYCKANTSYRNIFSHIICLNAQGYQNLISTNLNVSTEIARVSQWSLLQFWIPCFPFDASKLNWYNYRLLNNHPISYEYF